jgi:serine/threonine protein kinase
MITNGRNKPQGYIYKKGDVIGETYQVLDILGMGGFGVVYYVFSHESMMGSALKILRDEFIGNPAVEERFMKEAQVWVDLDAHPYLVKAYRVNKISEQLCIEMEKISPDEDGLNSLEGYLQQRPPNLTQSLRWAIQFCYGMEYVYSTGIRAHRDIKPSNIMITQEKTVKISDFGLAGVLSKPVSGSTINLNIREGRIGLSWQTLEGESFGTPTYMAPEQYTDAAKCDERSDIYSFGVVLYQMATGGKLPFLASLPKDETQDQMIYFWREMYKLHCYKQIPRVHSPLFPTIQRCLEKAPDDRYQSFKELREDLEQILLRSSGEVVNPPDLKELDFWSWNNKGLSLHQLGRLKEAIECYDRAIMMEPRWQAPWINKGSTLADLGHHEEAIECLDKAIEINPQRKGAWVNKGTILAEIGRYMEAIECYDKAIEIKVQFDDVWMSKVKTLFQLGRKAEGSNCTSMMFESSTENARAWGCKGNALFRMRCYEKAIDCYNKALEINPRQAGVWLARIAHSLGVLGRLEEAFQLYNRLLGIYPNSTEVLLGKGLFLLNKGNFREAILCFDRALELNPEKSLVWYHKGIAEDKAGNVSGAIRSYEKFIASAHPKDVGPIDSARRRLHELKQR